MQNEQPISGFWHSVAGQTMLVLAAVIVVVIIWRYYVW
jgi:hypothetical protein